MADTAAKAAPAAVAKPERPDEEVYKKNLAQAEKELKAEEERLRQIKAKLENAKPNNKDSPAGKRQAELRAELKSIRDTQQNSKSGRTSVMDNIKQLDTKLKAFISDSKDKKSKQKFSSAEQVQQEIDRRRAQVDSGTMKLVEEKKALDEIRTLTQTKKSFSETDQIQKNIDNVKAQIAELRKQLDDPESRALSDRYSQITAELDAIKAEQDEAFKSLNALRDERTKIHEQQQKKYTAVKEIKDQYYTQRRAAVEYEREAKRIREEKRRAENDAYHRGRRQEAAKSKLEEASAPAYDEEIRVTRSLLTRFGSTVDTQQATGPGQFAATDFRKVDDSGIKGTALKKKGDDDEAYFVGGGGKKKKGRKGSAAPNGAASPAPETSKFNLDLGTISALAQVNVDPPMSQADVPAVVEKLKEKLEFWKKDQDRKTKENVANAQKEIDRLEAEAAEAHTGKPAAEKQVNGSTSAGAHDGTAEVTDGIKTATIEEKTTA
ncbi:Putative nuclear segregation protein Bfr1 [Septoria linicola]|uniref:Nuclear segregation protein Bfr1 n=1 Tax=Septoria linicola TaxID=215465 RepID=A0A9Q9AWY6_9PEZI|nr:putative nuclear segregation protein Bfr1 [Septoria linicola]USW56544.1 Putative nuclear segregation protein Bfr1 [Septoria linicola]